MRDVEKTDAYPSTPALARRGLTAVACTAGGVFLLILQAIAPFKVLGLAAGALACIIGIVSLLSKDPADRKAGAVITGAGVLVMLSKSGRPFIQAAAGTLLGIGAVGLLAMGIINGIKFLGGLKQRS
ncbi:MAG: hypothetical protein LBD48_14055 [Treponema sp.]|jgi:hypothetical protein|nr:hypothetical protein [Treponema sp.]